MPLARASLHAPRHRAVDPPPATHPAAALALASVRVRGGASCLMVALPIPKCGRLALRFMTPHTMPTALSTMSSSPSSTHHTRPLGDG